MWLWLSGVWNLAIAIHAAQNCLGHTGLRVNRWLDTGRYPQRPGPDA